LSSSSNTAIIFGRAVVLIHLAEKANAVTTASVVVGDWDDGEEIVERLPVLLVVGDRSLNLHSSHESLTHAMRGNLIRALPVGTTLLSRRCLEEAAVSAYGFTRRVSGQVRERVRHVDDGSIGSGHIANNKGDRAVDRAKNNLRVWSSHDSELLTVSNWQVEGDR
jgi:hypothetical protein